MPFFVFLGYAFMLPQPKMFEQVPPNFQQILFEISDMRNRRGFTICNKIETPLVPDHSSRLLITSPLSLSFPVFADSSTQLFAQTLLLDKERSHSSQLYNQLLETIAVGFRVGVDGYNEPLWENMEVAIANPIEIQEEGNEEIPLVRDNVEPDIVDADLVNANRVDANFIKDGNDENDEDVVSEDDEDDFSDKESDIDSFDRDLEEDKSDDDSGTNTSSEVVVSQNQPLTEGDITQNDVQPPLSYSQKRRAQQALRNVKFADDLDDYLFIWKFEAHKHGPTRGLKSLCEREQNPNVKPFAKITSDMVCVMGKNDNRFIGECSKWEEWNLPIEADGINAAQALELEYMLLFRGWRYRLKEKHFSEKTINQAISNRPPKVHKDKWDWLVNHWADPKQQIIPSVIHPQDSTQDPHYGGAQDPTQQIEDVSTYVQLWERMKRHKDGSWDPEAAAKYEEFKELHVSQIKKEGADNLPLKEAYLLVMKEKSGYHRGLGPGPQPPRKVRATEVMRVEVAAKIQQLQ
ncbi:hypothetical protein Cgig2_016220 [Carnegiea gigantea]|uniref:Uncharacterized protein n=1 Tax=Carnegiea gigantea TaxID=171969 RepID=A0A9Q1JKZ8_9CARY|nr:hypothetical protein Cgig2_016220 [Carnegiea gigantea]